MVHIKGKFQGKVSEPSKKKLALVDEDECGWCKFDTVLHFSPFFCILHTARYS